MIKPDPKRLKLIRECYESGLSQRKTAIKLNIDRGVISRYVDHIKYHENRQPEKEQATPNHSDKSKSLLGSNIKQLSTTKRANLKPINVNTGRRYRLIVGIGDMHLPYSARTMLSPSARAILRFCADQKPDEVVLAGDYLDLACVSHWNQNRIGRMLLPERLIKN